MSLAAVVPFAVVLTVFALTLTTPAATQETTTPEMPDSNQPDNNCTFSVNNITYYVNDGEIKSVCDEVGTGFTWYQCEGGAMTSEAVSCRDNNQCADVTLGSIIDGNNTCVDCNTLYENCVNETETDNNNSNETETESSESSNSDVPNANDDTSCAGPERGADECSRDPLHMFTFCCDFCYNQRLVPVSENSNDTVESTGNDGGV